eukprot:TRINITY_DN9615_c0_g1_i1.p1 TRINITY_DN9615_c0_g1~~TRINITY_DN9615_c0_g1_i1.p1  ORF type:complete len:691 (-),score=135.03 TRINITY_DN9615_c0_g1_i1:107-1915(-)
MLKEELAQTMSSFTKDLAGTVGESVRKSVSSELGAMQAASVGLNQLPIAQDVEKKSRTSVSSPLGVYSRSSPVLPGGRAVLRGNFSQKKGVQKMVADTTKRKTVFNRGNQLGEFRDGVMEPLMDGETPPETESQTSGGEKENIPTYNTSLGRRQTPEEGAEVTVLDEGPLGMIRFVVTHELFEQAMGVVILISSVMVGVQADYLSKTLDEAKLPPAIGFIDFLTLICFTFEICVRMLAEGRAFFCSGDDVGWNLFDLCIVLSQLVDTILTLFTSSGTSKGMKALRIVRIVRLLRLLRLARLIRFFRIFMELRMIATTLIGTMRSLFGALGVYAVVIYLASICVTEQVTAARQQLIETGAGDSIHPEVEQYFGTLSATMMTLYQSSMNGVLWGKPMEELSSTVSDMLAPIFCFYIAFVFFAMVNVITGIFVKQSMEAAQEAQDDAMVLQINGLFNSQNVFGNFSYDEFETVIKSPEMSALFKAINIDVSEASLLYRLLDENGDGMLDYEEFINGALRLRGPAKSLELAMFTKESAAIHSWMTSKLKAVGEKVSEMASHQEATNRRLELIHHLVAGGQLPKHTLAEEEEARVMVSQLESGDLGD